MIRYSSQVPSCACRKRSRAAQASAKKSSVLGRGRFLEPWSLLFEPSLGHGPERIRGSCLYAVSSRASFHVWIAAVSEEGAGIATSSSSLFERDLGTSPQAHAVSSAGESALKPPPFGTGGRSGALAWPGESPCQSAPAWSAWRLAWGYGPACVDWYPRPALDATASGGRLETKNPAISGASWRFTRRYETSRNRNVVAGEGIEPPTRGFSIPCSTN